MTFTQEQIAYLESLPAVEHASATRITYAEDFRRICLERYRHGASPTAMFREAGLDPKLVGYKRIERCFARWKLQADSAAAGDGSVDTGSGASHAGTTDVDGAAGSDAGTRTTTADASTGGRDAGATGRAGGDGENRATATRLGGATGGGTGDGLGGFSRFAASGGVTRISAISGGQTVGAMGTAIGPADPRDTIIARQALLIDELEHEIAELRHGDGSYRAPDGKD
ncbi:hypothetical protein COO72_06300 [Bifidobacterium callitrichos]|nr:hypothetical protein COO72_06300 [Bifidobacterium callitrichos]